MNNNEDHIKKLLEREKKLGDDLYYTVKDEDGILQPRAGLWSSDGYGKESAEAWTKKNASTAVLVRISEVENQ